MTPFTGQVQKKAALGLFQAVLQPHGQIVLVLIAKYKLEMIKIHLVFYSTITREINPVKKSKSKFLELSMHDFQAVPSEEVRDQFHQILQPPQL